MIRGIADELEEASVPVLDEEDAEALASLSEAASSVPLDLTRKGDTKPAYGFERGGASAQAMRHKGSIEGASKRMQHRYKKLASRGLVKVGKSGQLSVTKHGKSALKKHERGWLARDKARRSGKSIGPTGKPLKRGEKMVFGRVVKVG